MIDEMQDDKFILMGGEAYHPDPASDYFGCYSKDECLDEIKKDCIKNGPSEYYILINLCSGRVLGFYGDCQHKHQPLMRLDVVDISTSEGPDFMVNLSTWSDDDDVWLKVLGESSCGKIELVVDKLWST